MSTLKTARSTLLAAAILGASGVGLGALGAHAMATTLTERGMTHAWETAARYHVFHAVALLGLAAWMRTVNSSQVAAHKWLARTARFWAVGTVLFSGSLYGLATGGPRWLGPVTPLGGVLLLLGWGCLAVGALTKEE